ncbi:MAG: CNNM domain-containing protein [Alkaliphilus sp.]
MSKRNSKKNNDLDDVWTKYNLKWVISITFWTFFLSIAISFFAEAVILNAYIVSAFIILLLIIFIGVFSDMIGVAITVASEKPFHAMASNKISGAKYAIKLTKNADILASFCNDVIGDICGIVSGVAVASIIMQLGNMITNINRAILTIALTGFTAALTVGGKALGKNIAFNNSQGIVFNVAKIMDTVSRRLKIDLISNNGKNKNNNCKKGKER